MLLILTDGWINDMEKTKHLLVKCSELPISVIIVAVGDADFDQMYELDGDRGSISDMNGNRCKRDVV